MNHFGFLTYGCLLFAVLNVIESYPQEILRDELQLSKLNGGVFRVVDETSCSCEWLFQPCKVEISEEMVRKTRGSLCHPLKRYCCQRETFINVSDLIKQMSTNQTKISTAGSGVQVAPKTPDANPNATPPVDNLVTSTDAEVTTDLGTTPPSGCLESDAGNGKSDCKDGSGDDGDDSYYPASSSSSLDTPKYANDTASFEDPAGTNTVVKPKTNEAEEKPEKSSQRKPKMIACSCMTREDCKALWAVFADLPEVKIRTTLTCQGKREVICCMGQVVPPRRHKSTQRGASKNTRRRPTRPNSKGSRPSFFSTLETIASWLTG